MLCQSTKSRRTEKRIWITTVVTTLISVVVLFIKGSSAGFACLENPCFHGICIDYLDTNSSHQCYCRNGFTGYSCQINWDECKSNPCLNNGICTDGIASFNCSCPENFAGALCQYDLSFCEELFPCQNNGTCTVESVNGYENFTCICPDGYAGELCEKDISICNSTESACLNGGKCIDGVGPAFYCKCTAGWTGATCETDIDECESQPCRNGGICVNKINDYDCACPFGYAGKSCETKLKICESNPCLNGAFCLHEHEDRKTCYCVPDYHGELCEFKYDDCDSTPKCFNGGTCIDGVGGFTCSCPPDVYGKHCQCTPSNITDVECNIFSTVITISESIVPSTVEIPASSEMLMTNSTQVISSTGALSQYSYEMLSTAFYETSSVVTPSEGEQSFISFYIESDKFPTVTDHTTMTIPAQHFSDKINIWSSLDSSPSTTLIQSNEYQTETSNTVFISKSEDLSSLSFATIYSFDGNSISDGTVKLDIKSSIRESPGYYTDDILPSFEITVITSGEITSQSMETTFHSQVFQTPSQDIDLSSSIDSAKTTVMSPKSSQREVDSSLFLYTTSVSADDLLSTAFNYTLDISTVVSDEAFPGTILYSSSPVIESFSTVSHLETPQLPLRTVSAFESVMVTTDSLGMDMSRSDALNTNLFTISQEQLPSSSENLMTFTVSTKVLYGSKTITPQSDTDVYTDIYTVQPTTVSSTTVEMFSSSLYFGMNDTDTEDFQKTTTTTLPPEIDAKCRNYCRNHGQCISDSTELTCLCSFKYYGKQCEKKLPKFSSVSFNGNSFLSYNINETINRINVKAKMATNNPSGLLFYTVSPLGRLYALIFLQNGHITLHFSCGAQSMHFIETRTRVDNGYNFTMDFTMDMVIQGTNQIQCIGQISVNGSYVMRGDQVVGHSELFEKPIQVIYIGGIDVNNVHHKNGLVEVLPGFLGCLYDLKINEEVKDIFDDAVSGKDVTDCTSYGCIANPCFGASECISLNQYPFWKCKCPIGFEGTKCQTRVCRANPCLNGATCTFFWDDGNTNTTIPEGQLSQALNASPVCLCPLGFTGDTCDKVINITKPSFKPVFGFDYSSYIAYSSLPLSTDWMQLKMHFVSRNISQVALLLYVGHVSSPNYEDGSDESKANNVQSVSNDADDSIKKSRSSSKHVDFMSLSFINGYIALTWNLGSGTQRIITPSKIDRRINVHSLFAGRSGKQAWLKVDGMRNVTGKSPGPFQQLNVNTDLFVGGYKSFRFHDLPHDLPLHTGFEGCVFDFGFREKNRLYLPKATEGRNVKNCYEEDC